MLLYYHFALQLDYYIYVLFKIRKRLFFIAITITFIAFDILFVMLQNKISLENQKSSCLTVE